MRQQLYDNWQTNRGLIIALAVLALLWLAFRIAGVNLVHVALQAVTRWLNGIRPPAA